VNCSYRKPQLPAVIRRLRRLPFGSEPVCDDVGLTEVQHLRSGRSQITAIVLENDLAQAVGANVEISSATNPVEPRPRSSISAS